MTKDITICFRTTENLRKALERISMQERRSVSSMIENILYDHLRRQRGEGQTTEEKRRYLRKAVGAPALVKGLTPDSSKFTVGTVVDLSLGGLQISVPETCMLEVEEDKENSKLTVIFTLPETRKPITVQCMPQHVYHTEGETNIGASFCDSDFASYQAIQDCLIN